MPKRHSPSVATIVLGWIAWPRMADQPELKKVLLTFSNAVLRRSVENAARKGHRARAQTRPVHGSNRLVIFTGRIRIASISSVPSNSGINSGIELISFTLSTESTPFRP